MSFVIKSPIIDAIECSEDIGGFAFNNQKTIVFANALAHKILKVEVDYLFGKPINKIINSVKHSDSIELDIERHRKVSVTKPGQAVVCDLYIHNCRFITLETGKTNSLDLTMFYIEHPRENIAACFFVEKKANEDINITLDKFIKLNRLKYKLTREINRREIDYRLLETYCSLTSSWKNLAIGLGSVVLFTTGIASLFISGLVGNKFGTPATVYYDSILESERNPIRVKTFKKQAIKTNLKVESDGSVTAENQSKRE